MVQYRKPLSRSLAIWSLTFALFISGCSASLRKSEQIHPVSKRTATVGDTFQLPVGRVTLKSVTATPPPGDEGMYDQLTLWLYFEFENTTDSLVNVEGFRGAPRPTIRTANGSVILVSATHTSFEKGSGGWGPGQRGVDLSPGGKVHASFGLRSTDEQFARKHMPLQVVWKPAGDKAAVFEVR